MALAEYFQKHYNSDVTGVGKAPLRGRISKYRRARVKRKHGFLGAKKIQDVEGIKPDTKFRLMAQKPE